MRIRLVVVPVTFSNHSAYCAYTAVIIVYDFKNKSICSLHSLNGCSNVCKKKKRTTGSNLHREYFCKIIWTRIGVAIF